MRFKRLFLNQSTSTYQNHLLSCYHAQHDELFTEEKNLKMKRR